MAVEQIWNESYARLGQFIRARVADRATAEDILHDVFVKFLSWLDEFREPARFSAGCSSSRATPSLTIIARASQRPNCPSRCPPNCPG
jgi:hypothetical protein